MVLRKAIAPNNRVNSMKQFTQELNTQQTTSATYPKSNEKPSIAIWPQAGRQNSEGFGGGRIVEGRKSIGQ